MVETPTAIEFKSRFPEFVSETDDRIDVFIAEAMRVVDDTWTTGDQQTAILYLAAHLLSEENDLGGTFGDGVASESWGQMSISYRKENQSGNSRYAGTLYGRRFWDIALRNKRGPVVI